MNLKITEKSVTFKITEDEIRALQAGEILEKKTKIGGNYFFMGIDPNQADSLSQPQKASLKLIWAQSESRLTLCTTPADIKKLLNMGKNKEGLSVNVDGLDIFLQVDVRANTSSRQKG